MEACGEGERKQEDQFFVHEVKISRACNIRQRMNALIVNLNFHFQKLLFFDEFGFRSHQLKTKHVLRPEEPWFFGANLEKPRSG